MRLVERAAGLFRALETEWSLIGSNSGATGRLVHWARREPVLAGFDSPADVVARCNSRCDPAWANSALQSLLRLAPDDGLAGRAVLQAVLPALAAAARRARRATASAPADPAWWEQEVVAIAWEQITALAANPPPWPATKIVDMTWTRVRTEINGQRRRSSSTVPLDESIAVSQPPGRSSSDQLAVVLGDAVRRGTIDREAAGVVLCTRVLGFSPAEAARAAGRTAAWAYKQRERAERSLVAAGATLPAAS